MEQSGHLFQGMWLKKEAMTWDARESYCEGIVGIPLFVGREGEDGYPRGYLMS